VSLFFFFFLTVGLGFGPGGMDGWLAARLIPLRLLCNERTSDGGQGWFLLGSSVYFVRLLYMMYLDERSTGGMQIL
jgi:hypothetical protein